MQTNYILKEAVMTALAILSIGLHSQAFAVGLGEIEVRSHIGQPLQARINVQGIGELKDKACFRIGGDSDGINAINHANLKLTNIKGDEGVLTISTTEAISEPIVSLSVIAECDSNFRRDYVLLIDPLLTTEINQTSDEETISSVENIDNIAKKPALAVAQTTRINNSNKKNTGKKQSADKQIIANKNTSNENTVLSVDYGAQKTVNNNDGANSNTSSAAIKKTPKESKPRLSISGGDVFNNANSIGLRLDKQLHFSAETAPEALASNIAVEDEATVLSNRLAHLEQQITTLQQRNNVLEAEKKLTTQPTQQNTQKSKIAKSNFGDNFNFAWWPYLAGAGLLIASYFSADFWRRRRQSQQLDNAEDVWDVLDANSNNVGYYKELDFNDTLFESKPVADAATKAEDALVADDFEATQTISVPFQIEEELFENNILDHADVFLSHGRTSLAIQLLQNHLQDYPKQSVTIWLFLLDLLAKENLQAVYEQTTLECKEHFNIRIAAFTNDEASPKQKLEDFPRLTAGLEQAWGTPAALVYLDDLIYNSRLENRVGFEKSVLEELVLLRSIAQSNVNKADVIQLDEKKMAIKELKEAKLAATKANKLQKLEELTLVAAAKNDSKSLEIPEEMFEFNLVDYK
ncbi:MULTISPECIES: type IV pilus assembly protein FimV [Methylotenera]|uniref:type IV pilus assembly protein FimV n=1 Tax=Methylotenera TaxID=359407 RepID=UPI0003A27D36|nr:MULTISPECIES: hypothetical protein [Methylotenera]